MLIQSLTLGQTKTMPFILSPWEVTEKVSNFFIDAPALTGEVRVLVYLGLLLAAIFDFIPRPPFGDSPIKAATLYANTLPLFRKREYFVEKILPWEWTFNRLRVLTWFTLFCWVCVILGVFGHLPVIGTGIGFFFLMSSSAGLTGVTHRWMLAMYSLLALCFCNGNANFSVDAWLTSLYPQQYPFPPTSNSLLRSGFGIKLLTIFAMFTLVSGGFAKLMIGGWKWMDGKSLAFYCSNPRNGYVKWMKWLVVNIPLVNISLSVSTIILELAAFLPVIYQDTALIWVIFLGGFHLGIWMTMYPCYIPQSIIYFAMVDWNKLLFGETKKFMIPESNFQEEFILEISPTVQVFIASFGVFVIFGLSCLTFFKVEGWPLTFIPMYSFYRGDNFNSEYIESPKQLIQLATEVHKIRLPHCIGWFDHWFLVELEFNNGEVVELNKSKYCALPKSFRHQLADVVKEDVIAKLSAKEKSLWNNSNPKYPAVKWINTTLIPSARKVEKRGGEIKSARISVRMKDQNRVLAESVVVSP